MKKGPTLKYAAVWSASIAGGVTLLWGIAMTFVFLPRWRAAGAALPGYAVILLRMPVVLFPVVFIPAFPLCLWWFRREDHREERP